MALDLRSSNSSNLEQLALKGLTDGNYRIFAELKIVKTKHHITGSSTRLAASLLLVSGRDGDVLRSLTVPDSAESYYSPVVYRQRGNTAVVLFGTGGETHRGALWTLPLNDLYAGDISQV